MWIRSSVIPKFRYLFRSLGRTRLHVERFRFFAGFLFLLLFLCTLPLPAAADQVIVRVILNQEEKGDFFVDQGENGDFLLKIADLKTLGFSSPSGTITLIEGEPYLALRSMEGVKYVFNEMDLSLDISALPSLLGKEIIDFKTEQKEKMFYPRDSSLFLNYGAAYQAGNGFSFDSFSLTNQLGIRMSDVLFLSDSVFTKDQSQDRFVRLQSSFTHDDRTTFRRFIVGDFFASSGDLGGSLNLGGVSFRKVYRMDPSYVYYPTLNLAGQTALPSEAKIYLNGMLLRTEKLSPGEFELKNLTPYGAAGTVEVVLRDSFGREQRLNYPFYYANSLLLKEGFHEYSYNLGFTREDYGSRSNRYSTLVFSAFHRYGFSDNLTLGIAAEAVSDLYNLGPQLTVKAGRFGVASLSLAGSTGRSSGSGVAGIASYTYQGLNFGANLSFAGYTRNYMTVSSSQTDEKTKYSAGCGLSYGTPLLGTVSLDLTAVRKYLGDDRDVAAVRYTRRITSQLSATATYRRVRENGNSNEFLISLNYIPKRNLFVSARYEQTEDSRDSVISVQKNPPVGEGVSYRADVKRSEASGKTTWRVNPYLQYNGRYGIYSGGFDGQTIDGERDSQYNLSVSGAIVYVGGTFGATRPVYDSFGLVNVGGLEGVRVLLNSEEVGATDSSGKLLIPNLGSYTQNQVGIRDRDIPMDYYISTVKKFVSPPLRSGSCIPFVIKKIQPISGRLSIRTNGELKPVEFHEVVLQVGGREFTFPTGSGGEFDIDLTQSDEFKKLLEQEEISCSSMSDGISGLLKPGTYQAFLLYEGHKRSFALTIPDSDDPFVDIGRVVIDEKP